MTNQHTPGILADATVATTSDALTDTQLDAVSGGLKITLKIVFVSSYNLGGSLGD